MSGTRPDIAVSARVVDWLRLALTLLAISIATLVVTTPARGNIGYELSPTTPMLSLGGPSVAPHGLAVDQVSQRLYVAVVTSEIFSLAPGGIYRFESNGTPAGTIKAGGNAYFAGVGIDPVTQKFFGAEVRAELAFAGGAAGTWQMDPFTSGGIMGTPFPVNSIETFPHIAVDSPGDVYYPNDTTDTVQVFNSVGAVQEEIDCSECSGGDFGRPVSVALNSNEDLYVVDLTPARVIKFTLSEGSYKFASVLQSGSGAAAVAVDPSTDDVLVGNMPNGQDYHIIAYSSSGTPFDDFGAGLFQDAPAGFDARSAYQLAVDATSHRLYSAVMGAVYNFDRVTTTPPFATTNPASGVGQLLATLKATVNANGHAVLDCDFEYVDDAEFQSSGYENASTQSCSKKPDGTNDVAVDSSASGLSPATEYHYRVVATSYAGTTTGSSRTFTTLPSVPPTVTTDPAVNVTQTGGTLVGRVNPHGGTITDCHFEFGTSQSYGSSKPCGASIGPVTTDVKQQLALKGLSRETVYHFRLVATTNAGSTEGADETFATVTPLPPVPDPPALPGTEVPNPPIPRTTPPSETCRKGYVKRRVGHRVNCVRRCKRGLVWRKARGRFRCVKRKRGQRANQRRHARVGRR